MANFTQDDCDALTSLETEKRYEEDGTTFLDYFVRASDANGLYYEFVDSVSASNASNATRKTNAHAYLIANCTILAVPISRIDDAISIL